MGKPIRILFVSHDSGFYGAQLSLLGLIEKLDRNRFDPWVVTPSDGPLVAAIKNLNTPIVISPMVHWVASGDTFNKPWIYRAKHLIKGLRSRAWPLAHLIERNEIDIVYTNTVTVIEGALAAKMTNRPHIWHLREQVSGNTQVRSVIPEFLIPWIVNILSQKVLVNSYYLYRAYYSYPLKDKLKVVYNGVNPIKFDIERSKSTDKLKSELHIPDNHSIVAIIGSLIPRKGQLLFAKAASIIVSSTPNVTFIVVGEGPSEYVNLVQNFVKEQGLELNFRFTGWREDIPIILAAVNILVIAADEEPFGRTVIEAMAAGIPVVSTKCGGPEEIIIDGSTGFLVPKNNPHEMANAIERILKNSALSRQLIQAGKDRLNKEFTLQAYAENIQAQLDSVIQPYLHNDNK
jgi:glycosyltransferase involved in cell wall biosynthesis